MGTDHAAQSEGPAGQHGCKASRDQQRSQYMRGPPGPRDAGGHTGGTPRQPGGEAAAEQPVADAQCAETVPSVS